MGSSISAIYGLFLFLLLVRVGLAVVVSYQRRALKKSTFRDIPLPPGPPETPLLEKSKQPAQVWRTYAAWRETYGSWLCTAGPLKRNLKAYIGRRYYLHEEAWAGHHCVELL